MPTAASRRERALLWVQTVDTQAIEAAGAELRYLPQYSPDLNPIENSFSNLKAFLRKCAERTDDALRRRIGSFTRRLPATACANFFTHCGYASI